jgi:hypothetical protein
VLRRIFRPKKEEVVGEWRKLNTVDQRRMSWVEHVAFIRR